MFWLAGDDKTGEWEHIRSELRNLVAAFPNEQWVGIVRSYLDEAPRDECP